MIKALLCCGCRYETINSSASNSKTQTNHQRQSKWVSSFNKFYITGIKLDKFMHRIHFRCSKWLQSWFGNGPFKQIRSEPCQEKTLSMLQNGLKSESSISRHHRSARNFATILMLPTALRVKNIKIIKISNIFLVWARNYMTLAILFFLPWLCGPPQCNIYPN